MTINLLLTIITTTINYYHYLTITINYLLKRLLEEKHGKLIQVNLFNDEVLKKSEKEKYVVYLLARPASCRGPSLPALRDTASDIIVYSIV